VSKHITEVMVGIDWTSANNAIWEFGKSLLRIGVHCVNLKSKKEETREQPLFSRPADRTRSPVPESLETTDVYVRKVKKQVKELDETMNETGDKNDVIQSVDSNQLSNGEIESTEADRAPTIGLSVQATSKVVSSDPFTEVRVSWTWEDLKAAQRADPEIGPIVGWLSEKAEQPPWASVTLGSSGTKTIWRMLSRLSTREGILRRRFGELNGSSNRWQIVLPSLYRAEFMEIAHGGMSGGHLANAETASGIQLRAYWPTWKTDLDKFLRAYEPCARYYRRKVRHQVTLRRPKLRTPTDHSDTSENQEFQDGNVNKPRQQRARRPPLYGRDFHI